MKIRIATPDDAAAIAALHASSWRFTYKSALSAEYLEKKVLAERSGVWSQRFASPKATQCILVVEGQGGVVGFVCAFAAEHAEWGSYLDNLHVELSQQGKGLGKVLLVEIAGWCERHAPGRGMYLSVTQSNHKAQEFYLGLGARNAEAGVWNAPDGSQVPTY